MRRTGIRSRRLFKWHRHGCSKPKDLRGNRPGHPEAEVVSENGRELCDCYKFLLLGLPSVGVLPPPRVLALMLRQILGRL
jgi:hypothetical protein